MQLNGRADLFHGTLYPDANGSGDYLIQVDVNRLSTAPNLTAEPESYLVRYECSGYFGTDNMTGIIPICTYSYSGLPCMIAFENWAIRSTSNASDD